MGRFRYLPMMKAKAGEINALATLTPQARARILPVFHIGEGATNSFAPGLAAIWAGNLTGLDGSFNANHSGHATAFQTMLNGMRNGGIPTMPVVGMQYPAQYMAMATGLIDGHGHIVKATLAELPHVHAWVLSQGWNPNDIDLVINVGHLGGVDIASYAGYVDMVMRQSFAIYVHYRSVTLSAAAAPKDHSGLLRGNNVLPRSDWVLWNIVTQQVPFRLDYSDYLTGHPDLTEPPGPAMGSATVSARYTLDNAWLIIKGVQTGGAYGLPMATQHQSHANIIIGYNGFNHVTGCWADAEFQAAAANITRRSGRQKWSEYAANRHISLVADRLP